MNALQVIILPVIQGMCELLPVSNSARVIVAAKLMGINASSPEMTFLLVMLHAGTMFAVIVYFWKSWRDDYFSSSGVFWNRRAFPQNMNHSDCSGNPIGVLRPMALLPPHSALRFPLGKGVKWSSPNFRALRNDCAHIEEREPRVNILRCLRCRTRIGCGLKRPPNP